MFSDCPVRKGVRSTPAGNWTIGGGNGARVGAGGVRVSTFGAERVRKRAISTLFEARGRTSPVDTVGLALLVILLLSVEAGQGTVPGVEVSRPRRAQLLTGPCFGRHDVAFEMLVRPDSVVPGAE